MKDMTTMNPSPTATSAREDARQSDGKFGAQQKSESQVELHADGTVPDYAEIFLDPTQAARA